MKGFDPCRPEVCLESGLTSWRSHPLRRVSPIRSVRLATTSVFVCALAFLTPSSLLGQADYRRGDANWDGQVDILDAYEISRLTSQPPGTGWTPAPPCEASRDYDENGVVNPADAFLLFRDLYFDVLLPSSCGVRPPTSNLSCANYDCTLPPPTVDPTVQLRVADQLVSPGDSIQVPIELDLGTDDVFALTLGLEFDRTLLQPIEVVPGAALRAAVPDPNLVISFPPGGVSIAWYGERRFGERITPAGEGIFAIVRFTVIGSANTLSPLTLTGGVGANRTPLRIFRDDLTSGEPTTRNGSIAIENQFTRGDLDGSGDLDISDGIGIVTFGFLGTEVPCSDAADFDDDGVLSPVNDLTALLGYLFAGGPPPPAPGWKCGFDPTEDNLDCGVAVTCP